ncbi:PREDICTED: uncharacterized protein LOC107189403 [Dufourea novaeangliae]|uniref:Uncharacterized protein n=1 Tax=Dufourea novaeangliae TaxID=178035 RepID=A0A154PHP9_DUFNO|nr:PREDICTED: uncharacterized protein LOC107189403 [Dufourea novaeangliae]KZC11332.1 hypothetical protein WN55_02567 [Dufourea novaeangliae]
MKLRTLYVLCCLCLSCTFAVSYENDDRNDRSTLNPSEPFESHEHHGSLEEDSQRDKRALGLILSGLAQVFGYNVDGIQVAALSNPNSDPPTDGGATPLAANQSSSSNSSQTSSTAAARQRETIRFTGVLNFGNNGSVLNHLQEYEQIFHGGSNTSTPMTNATSPASTPLPLDPRTPDSRQPESPLLVHIPLPVMRQPPLPEIPPLDIKLSYPKPIRFVPTRKEQETVNRKNESSVKLTLQSESIKDPKNVKSQPLPNRYTPTDEPFWKKEYEQRLAELERKQAEQAERLRQQERYKNRSKDNNYSAEDDKEFRNRGKQTQGNDDSGCSGKGHSSTDEDNSREKYQDEDRTPGYSSQGAKESEESEDERYRDYEKDYKPFKQEEDFSVSDNYTNVGQNEPLPLSGDDEHQWPEQLKNSYGEPLNSSELEDRFANFFSKFRHVYSSFERPDSKENPKVEDSSSSDEDEDASNEKGRDEYNLPATNKYEEYSLEEDTDTKRKDDLKSSEQDTSTKSDKLSNKFPSDDENQSALDDPKSEEEVDFSKFMPLIVPARYLSAPEETEEAKSGVPTVEKRNRTNNGTNRESTKKVSSKDARRPKKENLQPKANVLNRELPKRLHEGEQKEIKMWPPPFDFLLDSTIDTDVPPEISGQTYIKSSDVNRKVESRDEITDQKGERHTTTRSSRQRSGDDPQNSFYEKFKEGSESQTVSPRQPTESVNQQNRTYSKDMVEKPHQHLHQGNDVPDFWERYKYTSNDNYGNGNRQKIEIVHSTQRPTPNSSSKRFESLKRSTEKTEPVAGIYYTERSPVKNAQTFNDKNHNTREFQVEASKFVPPIAFDGPAPGFFHFPGMDYDFNQRIDNGAMIGVAVPQYDVYRYDESFTKFASEPENRSEKVKAESYTDGAPSLDISERKEVEANGPMGYVDFVHVL